MNFVTQCYVFMEVYKHSRHISVDTCKMLNILNLMTVIYVTFSGIHPLDCINWSIVGQNTCIYLPSPAGVIRAHMRVVLAGMDDQLVEHGIEGVQDLVLTIVCMFMTLI